MARWQQLATLLVPAVAAAAAWLLLRGRSDGEDEEPAPEGQAGAPSTATAAKSHAAAAPGHPHSGVIAELQTRPPLLQLPPRQPHVPPQQALGGGRSEYAWVDKVPPLAAAAMELYEQDRVGVDVEHHSAHSYTGVTCLLQISTGKGAAARRVSLI